MTALGQFGGFLRVRQRWVLTALLFVLHLTLLATADSVIGLMCWLVDVGLAILWQPFIQAERRLDGTSLLLIALLLAGGAWVFSWWFLILWVVLLAALLGGRVLLLGHRPTRVFYLLAFAYLLSALFFWLLPRVVPAASLTGPSLDVLFVWLSPLIFVAMLLMPRPREIRLPDGGMVDFFYSLFIFLLISVLVLGSLAFMSLRQSSYIEAVFKALVSMAIILLLIAWAWKPRTGFSGIGVFLSRYLLTIGLPFETWLQRLMECAEKEADPERFLAAAFERLLELPWVEGGSWSHESDGTEIFGQFGQLTPYRQDFQNSPLTISLYTRHTLSPSLVWHFRLLAQLTNEYYIAKQHARELQQMSYLRAVHETGARLTHDVKNLLQSLNNLCFAAQIPGDSDGIRLSQLFQRQLPQIALRLQQTLEKLQAPDAPSSARDGIGGMAARTWWAALQQRYSHDPVSFEDVVPDGGALVPDALFDSVADNLLQNALLKRQSEGALKVFVALSSDASSFTVCDSGSVVREDVVRALLRGPVASESGFGIGLFHAAKQAEAHGYSLRLTRNAPGDVCFELRRNT